MYKFTLILLCLFSPSFSNVYAPMSLRNFEFPVDDICQYQKTSDDFIYVEPCEKDYSCQDATSSGYPQIGICTKTSYEQPTYFNKACNSDDDCYDILKCVSSKCTLEENDDALNIGSNYYCPDTLIPVEDGGIYKCQIREGNDLNGLCYLSSGAYSNAYPDFMKVCGEITLDSSTYLKTKITVNSFGSVDNGKFVDNMMACKSGFALEFYSDGKITNPSSSSSGPFLKCVQVNGLEYKRTGGGCNIKYIVGNNNYVYDTDKTDITSITFLNEAMTLPNFCSSLKFIETYLDLFKQYINKMNQLGTGCTKSNYYDEPYTCRNDELRKLYYSMQNVEEYLLYKNEDEITEYLLQNEYPSYAVKFSKTDCSDFISNKFIYLLFLLLL